MPSHSPTKPAVSTSDNNGSKISACKTEILFRVWTGGTESKKLLAEETNAKRLGAIAFLEDIIASRKGVLVPTDSNLFVSVLESPSEALVISRQVQLGMQGFKDKSGNQPVAISISIDTELQNPKPVETRGEEALEKSTDASKQEIRASHDLLSLIRISRPAQILLTHDLFQQVSPFKGLPLKPFQGRFGVFEYVWTSEEKLQTLQSQQSRFADSVEESDLQPETPELAGYEAHSPSQETSRTRYTPEAVSAETRDWKRSLRSPWSMATIGVALLILIVGGVIMLRNKQPAPVTKSAQSPQSSTPIPATNSPSPRLSPITNGTQPSVTGGTQTHVESPKAIHKEQSAPQDRPKQKNDSAPAKTAPAAETAPPRTECRLDNPKRYLPIAEGYRQSGKYSDAERVFRQIVECEPSNVDALEGLKRTLAAEHQ